MKTIYTWLVAGMLAMATATPILNLSARPTLQLCAQVTITDALAQRILVEASGELEAQLGQSLNLDFLMNEYEDGSLVINYLGYDGVVYAFRVAYGGGLIIIGIEDI